MKKMILCRVKLHDSLKTCIKHQRERGGGDPVSAAFTALAMLKIHKSLFPLYI